MNKTPSPFPYIREFAKEGIFSEYTLRLMLKQGKLPHIMCGNRCRINRALFMKQIDDESKRAVMNNEE